MKIAVVGSRGFKDVEFVRRTVGNIFNPGDTLISGGAKGVDTYAEELIDLLSSGLVGPYNKKIILPDWNKYGKSAGFIRNKLIIDEADLIIAFWDGTSKGTKHDIDLALASKKPINIYVRN